MLKLHNTLTRKVESFKPIDNDKVTLYTCGPTVYHHLQIGNWVAYLRWDTLVRVLQADDYKIERVMNITDVGHLVSDADEGEDKMEKGAKREGKTAWEIAKFYTDDFLAGMKKLNLLMPEQLAKATDHIPEQIALVQKLEDKGFTYKTSDGVYFDTSKFPTYADFAQLDVAGLRAGARVEANHEKRNPTDFALWKFTPKGQTRDMEWDSPWGKGFPGWHLECSAMALKYLGNTLDIHTGGIDHIPVHHTNEIAQSEAATGKKFANYWLHANFLTVDGVKLSKSLGNSYTLDDITARGFSPLDFRMFALQSQYRTENNFTWEALEAAHNRLQHWREIAVLRHQTHDTIENDDDKDTKEGNISLLATQGAILEAFNNDLDTPAALRLIDEAFSKLENHHLSRIHHQVLVDLLQEIDNLLGLQLLQTTPDISDDIKQLIVRRQRARDAQDWGESDRIRDILNGQGIAIRDTAFGSVWSWTNTP